MDGLNLSLKKLRYFEAVARLGHFGRAADQCAVTQPALSMQIAALERELGVVLLERRTTGVQLTETGRGIAERARRILNDVRDLGDFARHHQNPLAGTLRLGVIPSIAPYLLPRLLPKLRSQCGQLDLRVRETVTHLLVDQLFEGELDLLLLALPLDRSDIETFTVVEDRFVLAVPDQEAADPLGPTPLDRFRDHRLLLLEEGHCLRDQAVAFCRRHQIHPSDRFGASSLSTLMQMVANGLGMTLLPEISLAVEGHHQAVRFIRFDDPQPSRTLALAWRASSPRKEDFRVLGDLMTAIASEAGATTKLVGGRRLVRPAPA
ncbi:MAG: LysR substrate-binding domain-containing protein [Geminicoccaceae bacterium]